MSREELQAAYDAGEPWTRYSRGGSTTSIKYDEIARGEGAFLRFASCAAIVITGSMMLIGNFLDVAKILIAPKIWLIEYAASLAK